MTPVAMIRRPLRLGDAAKELGVHPDTILKAERVGRIPPIRRELYGSDDRIFFPEDIEALRKFFRSR